MRRGAPFPDMQWARNVRKAQARFGHALSKHAAGTHAEGLPTRLPMPTRCHNWSDGLDETLRTEKPVPAHQYAMCRHAEATGEDLCAKRLFVDQQTAHLHAVGPACDGLARTTGWPNATELALKHV